MDPVNAVRVDAGTQRALRGAVGPDLPPAPPPDASITEAPTHQNHLPRERASGKGVASITPFLGIRDGGQRLLPDLSLRWDTQV